MSTPNRSRCRGLAPTPGGGLREGGCGVARQVPEAQCSPVPSPRRSPPPRAFPTTTITCSTINTEQPKHLHHHHHHHHQHHHHRRRRRQQQERRRRATDTSVCTCACPCKPHWPAKCARLLRRPLYVSCGAQRYARFIGFACTIVFLPDTASRLKRGLPQLFHVVSRRCRIFRSPPRRTKATRHRMPSAGRADA